MTDKKDALPARRMAQGLVMTARSIDTYLEALRTACTDPNLTADAKSDIQQAARHLLDAQHHLQRAANKVNE